MATPWWSLDIAFFGARKATELSGRCKIEIVLYQPCFLGNIQSRVDAAESTPRVFGGPHMNLYMAVCIGTFLWFVILVW